MANHTQFDNLRLENLNLPYDLSKNELSTDPRLVLGSKNTYCTLDGALVSRPPDLPVAVEEFDGKVAHMVYYEPASLNSTTGNIQQYIIASYYNPATLKYEIGIFDQGITLGAPVIVSSGLVAGSSRPHEIIVVRGKAYIKSFPTSGTDKLGLYTLEVLADGTTVEVNKWGLLGPTIPARLASSGQTYAVGSWNGSSIVAIDASVTAITAYQGGGTPTLASLTPPFEAWLDSEKVLVTSKTVGTPALYDTYTVTRGYDGTTAAPHATNTLFWATPGWTAADFPVECKLGWAYSYCWKNKNGQYSNRAKLETNLSSVPSVTPPTRGKIPKITVTCPSDTTQYPKILMLRTTDGGGTFFPLTEIDNPGTSTTVFEDKYFPTGSVAVTNGITYDGPIPSTVSGVTFNTPVPDTALSGQYSGPGLLTNSPLPTVTPPKVVGTDYPEKSTQMAYWKNRIWLAINNVLYFTSLEELPYGIPEESCDTSATGGFFRFQENITQIYVFGENLLVFTRSGRILKMTGSTKDTFVPESWLENIGFAADQPRAITRDNDKLYFLSSNYHIVMLDENSSRIISHPLGSTIADAVALGMTVFLSVYKGNNKEWLVLGLFEKPDAEQSVFNLGRAKLYVYDLYKSHKLTRNYSDNITRETVELPEKTFDFWNSPWDVNVNSSAMISCSYKTETANPRQMLLVHPKVLDTFTEVKDYKNSTYKFVAITGLMENPAGYHVSTHAVGGLQPNVWGVRLERLEYAGDRDPNISIYKDSLWVEPIPLKQDHLQYIRKSGGYRVIQATLDGIGKYFAVKIEQNPNRPVNLQKLTVSFQPGAGV